MSEHAISNAKAWLESIVEMVETLDDPDERFDEMEALDRIHESVLSVQVRGGWRDLSGIDKLEAEEFYILLTTGGPALRIYGSIGLHGEPEDMVLQWQDWGTPWTTYYVIDGKEALETFTRQFYFGE